MEKKEIELNIEGYPDRRLTIHSCVKKVIVPIATNLLTGQQSYAFSGRYTSDGIEIWDALPQT